LLLLLSQSFFQTHAAREACSAANHPDDCLALTDLAISTNYQTWVNNKNWLIDNDSICDYDLVGCDSRGRVKILALSFNNMTGSLPPTIRGLSELQDFDIEYNHISGSIPNSIGDLTVFQLGFGGNQFEGAPDELCKLPATSGTACDLSGNNFNCPLPDCALDKICAATCK